MKQFTNKTSKLLLSIIVDSFSLTAARVIPLLASFGALFFLIFFGVILLSLGIPSLIFVDFLGLLLFYFVSFTWYAIFMQIYSLHHHNQHLRFRQCFKGRRLPLYHFCGALLIVYSMSDVCYRTFWPSAYFMFIALVMTVVYVYIGIDLVKSTKRALQFSWKHLFATFVVFLPPMLCLVLPLYAFVVWHLHLGKVLLPICTWLCYVLIAFVIVWFFATSVVLQSRMDPDTVAPRFEPKKKPVKQPQG